MIRIYCCRYMLILLTLCHHLMPPPSMPFHRLCYAIYHCYYFSRAARVVISLLAYAMRATPPALPLIRCRLHSAPFITPDMPLLLAMMLALFRCCFSRRAASGGLLMPLPFASHAAPCAQRAAPYCIHYTLLDDYLSLRAAMLIIAFSRCCKC